MIENMCEQSQLYKNAICTFKSTMRGVDCLQWAIELGWPDLGDFGKTSLWPLGVKKSWYG